MKPAFDLSPTRPDRCLLTADGRPVGELCPPVLSYCGAAPVCTKEIAAEIEPKTSAARSVAYEYPTARVTIRVVPDGTGLRFEAGIVRRKAVVATSERIPIRLAPGSLRYFGRDRRWHSAVRSSPVFLDPWTPRAVLAHGGLFTTTWDGPAVRVAGSEDGWLLEIVYEEERLHPLRLIDTDRTVYPGVEYDDRSPLSLRAGETSEFAWHWTPWTGSPPPVPTLWPGPARAARS